MSYNQFEQKKEASPGIYTCEIMGVKTFWSEKSGKAFVKASFVILPPSDAGIAIEGDFVKTINYYAVEAINNIGWAIGNRELAFMDENDLRDKGGDWSVPICGEKAYVVVGRSNGYMNYKFYPYCEQSHKVMSEPVEVKTMENKYNFGQAAEPYKPEPKKVVELQPLPDDDQIPF